MGKQKSGSEPNLKGTLLSVFGVGLVIVVMWFSVYGLYVSR
ncbi:MAG TPA: cytochrome C oxidase subunit II [Bacillaceae bacterium]